MLCVMMLPLVVVGCTSKQSVQSVRDTPPARGCCLPRLADTAEHLDYFTLKRGASHYTKNNWKEPRSILMSSADRVAHIDGPLFNYCEQYARASSGYKCLK